MNRPRAAHFLLIPELAHSPPNEALVSAFLELGLDVDLFAPGLRPDQVEYGGRVRSFDVSYGRRWLASNLLSPRWLGYRVLSATSERPLATMGTLAKLWRRPSIALVDEIKAGSYRGDDPESWKRRCRSAVRAANLRIVNDDSRVDLLREYAAVPEASPIIVYPGGFHEPPPACDRSAIRREWGFADDDLVIGFSGGLNRSSGIDWLLDVLAVDARLRAVLQPLGIDDTARLLLDRVAVREQVFLQAGRLGWREAWSQAAALDIGLAIYRNPAPQFQHMGTSSNRLCMFLAMGVPVVATCQESFRFLEEYECGVLVDSANEFVAAIAAMRDRLPELRSNAARCWREYVDSAGGYRRLREQMRSLLS